MPHQIEKGRFVVGMYKTAMHIVQNEDQIKTADGAILYMRGWLPRQKNQVRAVIGLVHGYAEHCSRYNDFAKQLVTNGFAVYAYDHRGHGKSEGLRAYIPSFDLLQDDLTRFINKVRNRWKEPPLFLLGHSMGGCMLAHAALDFDGIADGLILSSPGIVVKQRFSFLVYIVGQLASLILPTLSIPKFIYYLDVNALSRRQKSLIDYQRDPFIYHGKMRNRTGMQIKKAMRKIQKHMNQISVPMLIILGDADEITDCKGSKMLYEKAATADKTLNIYPGGYHELFFDKDHKQVMDDVLAWLNKRL